MIITLNKDCCELKKNLTWGATFHPPTFTRRHLRRFRGARLAVFISVLLHSNDEGWAKADIPQLERETGYKRHTVESAVSGLCKLEVEGQRIMLAVPERKRIGLSNCIHLLLFPTEVDIARYEGLRSQ